MRIYLLLTTLLWALSAHSCQQVGSSSLAQLAVCTVTTPPPQLQWSINITLLEDYSWRGSDEIKYVYLTADDQEIEETCYQGQTIKGNYKKGTSLLIEQLCFNFKPSIRRGDKLYITIFWDRPQRQVIYLSFSSNGSIQIRKIQGGELAKVEQALAKNLVTQ